MSATACLHRNFSQKCFALRRNVTVIVQIAQALRLEERGPLRRVANPDITVCLTILQQSLHRAPLIVGIDIFWSFHASIVDNSLHFVKDFSRFVLKGLATHVYNSPKIGGKF